MTIRAVRLDTTDRHDAAMSDIGWEGWPRFMHEDPIAETRWSELYRRHRDTQAALLDGDEVVGNVHAIPIRWEGTVADLPDGGWDEAFVRATDQRDAGVTPNTLCALAIVLPAEQRGRGLAALALAEMRTIAADRGFGAVIACVRPSLKATYPLTPFERYIRWTTPDGEPFDPWMRVHARAGATISKPVAVSMEIPGTVADWEGWTGLRFPESGRYVVPGALEPVDIDVEADRGVYREPNVWMVHRLAAPRG